MNFFFFFFFGGGGVGKKVCSPWMVFSGYFLFSPGYLFEGGDPFLTTLKRN